MAQNAEANILVTIKEKGKEALEGIQSSLASVVKGAAAMGAALIALGVGIGKLALDAAQFGEIENAFRKMAISQGAAADTILEKMKEASDGVLSTADAMKLANTAMMAGIPVDKIGEITKIAKAAASSTGESIETMMGSLTNGLARGSTMMLRHAGIVFDAEEVYKTYAKSVGKTVAQLTESEKKQVFLNAALKGGQENLAKLGDSLPSAADKWDKLKATIADLTIDLGKAAIPAFESLLDITLNLFNQLTKFVSSEPGKQFFLGIRLFITDAKHSVFSFINTIENLATTLISFGKAAGAAITLDFKSAGRIITENQAQIEQKNVEFAAQREAEIAAIVDDFNAKKKEATEKKENEAKEAAINREKIKQKELAGVARESSIKEDQIDNDMFYEKLEIQKKMARDALDERVRRRESLERQEKEALEILAKEHADTVTRISALIQATVSGGLQSLASKALSFIPEYGVAISQVFDLLSQNTEQFRQTLYKILGPEFVENVLKNLVVFLEEWPSIFKKIIDFLAENMPAMVENLVKAIIAYLPEITAAFITAFTKMLLNPRFLADLGAAIAKGFAAGISSMAGDIADAVAKGVKDGLKALTDLGGGGGSGGFVGQTIKRWKGYHGGVVPGYAGGGLIDNTLIRATPGEFVVNRDSAGANLGLLRSINDSMGRSVNASPTIVINVQGGLLGDRESARQFALAVDQELYRLRQGNESRAFDRSLY